MKALKLKLDWKYFWVELSFLLFISFGVSLISDLEYSAYEEHNIRRFANDIGYRLITGSFSLITYAIFYFAFLKRYVFGRKIISIILCSVGFVIVDQLMGKFPSNWVIIHTNWVSESLRKRAIADLLRSRIIFTFNYRVTHSIIPLIGLAFLIRSLIQEKKMKELKEQQLVSEITYLKAQLHPHFFFNTINNIYSLALQQSALAAPMVARLGELMRYILYEANKSRVPLQQELKFLEGYVEVEQMRYAQEKEIDMDVQGVEPFHEVEPLLLLPFVENAFKHGLAEEIEGGFVRIIVCRTEKELVLEVVNSKPKGNGRPQAPGIGTKNVRKRLDLLYPNCYTLEVQEDEKQYQVSLALIQR